MRIWLITILLALAACQQPPARDALVRGAAENPPEALSKWNLLEIDAGTLRPARDGIVYELATPLFSDYAHKLRSIHVPAGTAIRYGEDAFTFPVGTIITKTFYYPVADASSGDRTAVRRVARPAEETELDLHRVRLLETRLLVNTRAGWIALPYVWNDSQTEATLELAGAAFELDLIDDRTREPFLYEVPDANQCASCHAVDFAEQRIAPIGIKARHLNRDIARSHGAVNQLAQWSRTGILTGAPDTAHAPQNARWDDPSQDLNARARAYLDINCGHCHSATAAANTSGLLLNASETNPIRLGRCKVPVATGRGSGTGAFDIVPGSPDESILLQRIMSTEPDIAMPEIGRSVVHAEGVVLIRSWIRSMSGGCDVP